MAIIKVYFRKNAKTLLEYVQREGAPNDPVYASGCTQETAISDFEATRKAAHSKGKNEAMHVIQSWSEEESKKHPPEFFNAIGQEMASEYFKGHEFVIRTHTDTGKFHNHIVVNMVNFETGKMLENKKYHLYRLRDQSDKICQAKGLSVINREAKERQNRLPDKVLRMSRFNRFSYIFDTKQKADFARKYSTSYDEYAAILGQLGVTARIEKKKITYFYNGVVRGKRGDKLGPLYDKKGLEEAFQKNDALFRERPELRASVAGKVHAVVSGSESLSAAKDYSRFTKVARGPERRSYPFEKDVVGSMVPLDEIRKARMGNIFEYCKRNKLEIAKNEKGQSVLKGRPFVVVTENEWINTKNKTRGTLIEFAAAHKEKSFLQAISHINNNPRLLLLENTFGEQKRKFTSFYFPKEEAMDWKRSVEHFSRFLTALSCSSKVGETLLKKQQVQVGKNGVIRFFGKDEQSGALEFTPNSDGTWTKNKKGTIQSPFFARRGTGRTAIVFTDPLALLQHHGNNLFSIGPREKGVLALLEPSKESVDKYVATNKQVKELIFALPRGRKPTTEELDLFSNLKKRYLEMGIHVRNANATELHREGPTMSR